MAGRDLGRLTYALPDTSIAHHQPPLEAEEGRRISLDLDPRKKATRTQERLALSKGCYDTWGVSPVEG